MCCSGLPQTPVADEGALPVFWACWVSNGCAQRPLMIYSYPPLRYSQIPLGPPDVLVTSWLILSPLCRDERDRVEDSKEDLLCD